MLTLTVIQTEIIASDVAKAGLSLTHLEEEMIDLIQYQRGFESSAKFLSTVDEMMTAILQLRG